jgi:hypothetical protein
MLQYKYEHPQEHITLMAARVANGVRLLDEKVPHWRDLVDADAINMANGAKCVVGQVLAPLVFSTGVQQLGLRTTEDFAEHGFYVGLTDFLTLRVRAYPEHLVDILDVAWSQEASK